MIVALRQANETDVDWIFSACQDAEIQRWTMVPKPYSRTDAQEFVKASATDLSKFVIVDAATQLGVGTIAVHSVSSETGEASAGYWVAQWARRQGVATQALKQLLGHARTLNAARSLTLEISPGNTASRGVAARSGFIVIRTRLGSCHDGDTKTDGLIYSLTL